MHRDEWPSATLGHPWLGWSDLYADNPGFSKTIKPGYDTHFVLVRYYGTQWYGQTLNYNVDYQACPAHEAEAHEVVSQSFAQICPIAILYFIKR